MYWYDQTTTNPNGTLAVNKPSPQIKLVCVNLPRGLLACAWQNPCVQFNNPRRVGTSEFVCRRDESHDLSLPVVRSKPGLLIQSSEIVSSSISLPIPLIRSSLRASSADQSATILLQRYLGNTKTTWPFTAFGVASSHLDYHLSLTLLNHSKASLRPHRLPVIRKADFFAGTHLLLGSGSVYLTTTFAIWFNKLKSLRNPDVPWLRHIQYISYQPLLLSLSRASTARIFPNVRMRASRGHVPSNRGVVVYLIASFSQRNTCLTMKRLIDLGLIDTCTIHALWELISKWGFGLSLSHQSDDLVSMYHLKVCPAGSCSFQTYSYSPVTLAGIVIFSFHSNCKSFPMKQLIEDVGANRSRVIGYVCMHLAYPCRVYHSAQIHLRLSSARQRVNRGHIPISYGDCDCVLLL